MRLLLIGVADRFAPQTAQTAEQKKLLALVEDIAMQICKKHGFKLNPDNAMCEYDDCGWPRR